jgi:xanthine dehydrogenase small subunit
VRCRGLGVCGIGVARLGREGVRRQPVEQLAAVAGDDVDLRAVHVGVDEAGQDEPAAVIVALPALPGRLGLHGDDPAAFGEQPVIGAKAHRRRIDVAPGRVGAEIEQVAADGEAHRGVGTARHGSRGKAGWHANRVYTIGATMSSRPIRFFHRGAVVEIDGAAPTRTVLDWLREDARCTGTKEGCNEGDCGACTVVIGELAPRRRRERRHRRRAAPAQRQRLHPVPADARRQGALHRRGPPGRGRCTHPGAAAMVACHGSQCGFCTPGFVMSLWATYQHHGARDTRPSRQQIADELSGNLCRCTGYRPIVDAGERMFDLPAAPLDAAPAVAALTSLRAATPLRSVGANGAEFIAPRTLDDFAAALLTRPDARILAGSTDIGLWVNKMFRDLPRLIYIGAVDELKRIDERDGILSIGAAASLEDAWRALVARWPTLAEVWLRFAGVPLRHTGTMGGNVANGSPIGDSAPVLMALDASLVLRRGEAIRRVRLADFYTGYMKNLLEPGEFVQAIEVPTASRRTVRAYKISKRFDCDISAVCAGLALELAADGTVTAARTRLRRHGGDGPARGTRRKPRWSGQAWDELPSSPRRPRWRSTSLRSPTCARALPTACRSRRTCSGASGSRRDRARRSRRTSRACGARWRMSFPRRAPRRRREPLARSAVAASRCNARRRDDTDRGGTGVGAALPHESAHLHVAGAAPYVDDLPELAGTLHAALGLSPVAHGRLVAVDRERIAAMPGVIAVLVATDIPGANDCGPVVHDDPILADGVVHYLGQPVFAVIAETRDLARRAAAQAKAALTIEPLAPILTPVEAHAAKSYVLAPMHLARGNARACHRRRAASARRRARGRRPGAVLSRGPDLLRGAARGPRHARPLLDAASERDAAPGRHLPRPAVAPRPGRVPAHGRRLRRQGVAVGPVRVRRRDRGEAGSAVRSSCASTATTTS